jgi:predicted AAA+ superfamily ATPase
VGKTTGIYQIIQDLLRANVPARDIIFIRFDLELLREEPAAMRTIVQWYTETIRQRPLDEGSRTYLFLDEIHKLRRWSDEVKHIGDTFPVRMLLTGSSSVLVARGGRESLAGRVFTTELPTFSFREVLECWKPHLAESLPPSIRFSHAFSGALLESSRQIAQLRPQQKLAIGRSLERYYSRGGYPRLHSGDIDDDVWADYLVQTVFDNVLGADIPDLFPVHEPQLLRHLYLSVARLTGQIVPQTKLTEIANVAKFATNQPTVGKYLHYLADALLVREFRRYPLAKKASARVPAKLTVSDLGVRNAIFRGAPSLSESDPTYLGPLVETMVQGVIRDHNLQVHYYREHETPHDYRSTVREVDFVAETLDGLVLPIEVKFRKRIREDDVHGLLHFVGKYQKLLDKTAGVVVTRGFDQWDENRRILFISLPTFLLAF